MIGTCQVCGTENCEVEHVDIQLVNLSLSADKERWVESYVNATSQQLRLNALRQTAQSNGSSPGH